MWIRLIMRILITVRESDSLFVRENLPAVKRLLEISDIRYWQLIAWLCKIFAADNEMFQFFFCENLPAKYVHFGIVDHFVGFLCRKGEERTQSKVWFMVEANPTAYRSEISQWKHMWEVLYLQYMNMDPKCKRAYGLGSSCRPNECLFRVWETLGGRDFG